MDIFSHGLWAGAGALALKKKIGLKINPWVAGWWGLFPDLFAFTIPTLWILSGVLTGTLDRNAFPDPHAAEPAPPDGLPMLQLASMLYNWSHSLVIFALVFGIVWFVLRRPVWELGGWLLHILADIPTHSYQFFPTPVFWPLFTWKFDGFSWGTPWFLIPDYILLAVVFYLLLRKRKQAVRADSISRGGML
ncbi:MAG: hypothetical protein AAB581_02530 [Patescibacteria group bacterium]